MINSNTLNSYRVVPRLLVAAYCYLVYSVFDWFILLDAPTTEQSAFATIIVTSSAGVFKFYVDSGNFTSKQETI